MKYNYHSPSRKRSVPIDILKFSLCMLLFGLTKLSVQGQAPQVVSISPEHNSSAFEVTTFFIRFDRAVSIDDNRVIALMRDGKSPTVVSSTLSNNISGVGTNRYAITFPSSSWVLGERYYIAMPGNVFKSFVGGSYFVGSNETNWSFIANNAPSDITLSNRNITENSDIGSLVGSLSVTDLDAGQMHTFSFATGTGDNDNDSFTLVDGEIFTNESIDYETKQDYSIRIAVEDDLGGRYEEAITIDVVDVDEIPPVLISTSPTNGAVDLEQDLEIRYTFSENMAFIPDETRVTLFNVTNTTTEFTITIDETGNPSNPLLSVEDNVVILNFAGTTWLDNSRTYRIIAFDIADLAGNEIFTGGIEFTLRDLLEGNDILSMDVPGLVGAPVIDPVNHTVVATLGANENTTVMPTFTFSENANSFYSEPDDWASNELYWQSGDTKSLSVLAENGISQFWSVTLNFEPYSGTYLVGENGYFETLSETLADLQVRGQDADVTLELEDGHEEVGFEFLEVNPFEGSDDYSLTITVEDGATDASFSYFTFRLKGIQNFAVEGKDVLKAYTYSSTLFSLTFDDDGNPCGNISFSNLIGQPNPGQEEFAGAFIISNSDGVTHSVNNVTVKNCLLTYYDNNPITISANQDVEVLNNKVTIFDMDESGLASGISVRAEGNVDIMNNSVAVKTYRGSGIGASGGTINILNNTIWTEMATIRDSQAAGISVSSVTTELNIINNIVQLDGTGKFHDGLFLWRLNGISPSISNNNIYISDEISEYNYLDLVEDNLEYARGDWNELIATFPTNTNEPITFMDEEGGDLELSTSDQTSGLLRGAPLTSVPEDINGITRSLLGPSIGAYEYANDATDIISFSIPDQVHEALINYDAHIIQLNMEKGSTKIQVPTIIPNNGATVGPSSGIQQDFSSPITYTVTSETGIIQNWVVSAEEWVVWNDDEWTNNTPPSVSENAIVLQQYSSLLNGGSIVCNDLTIPSGITVLFHEGYYVDIQGDLINEGFLAIYSGASVLTYSQNDVSGTGDYAAYINTRYADNKYSFIGPPLDSRLNIQTTTSGNYVYTYNESIPYGTDDGLSRWEETTSGDYIIGKGYAHAGRQTISFLGELNRGTITYPGTYTEDTDDANEGWNLVANPYTAAISVADFLTENTNITGSVYIWDDNGSDTGRGTNADYIVANATMASATAAGGQSRYNFHLGSAQGFFVKLNDNTDTDITFTEAMRVSGSNSDDNFFRKEPLPIARLNLTDTEGLFKQTVIGFANDATVSELNQTYDAPAFNAATSTGLYSVKSGRSLSLNGMPQDWQSVQLQLNIDTAGTYSISLELENYQQSVYLKDHSTDKVIDISQEAYSFQAEAGINMDRFELLSSPYALLGLEEETIKIYAFEKVLHIESVNTERLDFQLYNLSGKFIDNLSTIGTQQIDLAYLPNGVYILFDGVKSKKILLGN